MLISVRSTNGGGKSTLVRSLIAEGKGLPRFGLLGPKKPEVYELRFPKIKKPVYVLGPYLTQTGGCDCVQPYDLILELIEKYGPKGHVVFEGVIVSSSYGRVGRLMESYGQQAVMAFLTTSLEECIKNVQKRRGERLDARELNPKNLTSKFNSIAKSKIKITAEGKVRVVDLDPYKGTGPILELLRSAT